MGFKKKYTAFIIPAALAVMVSACGAEKEESPDEETTQTEASAQNQESEETTAQTTETALTDANNDEEEKSENRILIAYFTAAENSGVDAEASASYSEVDGEAKGRMQALAEMIQAEVGGDLFSIQTEEVYPADGGELIDYAAEEQEEDARPALSTHIDDISQYDTIFLGYPNWWADLPQPLYSFLDEYDLSGKTIIPFNSHNGSRFSNTISTIQELEPNAEVITDGFTINERDVPDAAEDIANWLEGLGF